MTCEHHRAKSGLALLVPAAMILMSLISDSEEAASMKNRYANSLPVYLPR